jgi:hypothetical protein
VSLKKRKILYASLALGACVVWVPLAFAGIALLVGAIGLMSIGALFRAIAALPVIDKSQRWYFSAAIGIGIVLMSGFILLRMLRLEPNQLGLPDVSGTLLMLVAMAVLKEINAKHN